MSETLAPTESQFDDAAQQREAAALGMWVFLATEVLFFGGIFFGYTVYRLMFPEAFALASRHTLLLFGGPNTALLLFSSLTMVLGVRAAEEGKGARLARLLAATAALGSCFLLLKGFEYAHEIHEGLLPGRHFHLAANAPHGAEMFFYIYFLATGVHALHVSIGVVLISCFAWRAWRKGARPEHGTSVDLLGLYWHFVDVVWVFLFPLIYLVDRHHS